MDHRKKRDIPATKEPTLKKLFSVETKSRYGVIAVRKQGRPDVLLPTTCPSACQPLFRADEVVVPDGPLGGRCSCVCPRTAPVYLHTAGHCVDRLDECRYNLVFNSSVDTERLIPVVSLPAKNGVVLPKVPILWNGSGITVSSLNTVDCTVSEVFVDNVEHRWKAVSRRALFGISTARGRPTVMFRGSDAEVTMLTGAVIQLKLFCNGFAADEHCLSFRVAGVSGLSFQKILRAISHVIPSNSSRVELLLIFVLLFLLVLSIGGSLILWQLCWRIKKQKLISTIQMQFLFHLQQQQEVRKVAETQVAVNDMGPCEFKTLMERIPKRRLYFSAEYLDKEMMENPPPMAEQFLIDLRRVIEIARERIRMRRFVPMLITIPEDLEESRSTVTGEDNAEKAVSDMYQESPKSDKSVDSGRESRSDSDDSSRDEEEEKTKNWPDVHTQPDRIHNVSSVVNGSGCQFLQGYCSHDV
ncbi:unnamed protein product [Angiostrongylus costaricensis]|uniref:Protein kinase domain-containing protein n=1 Tax=Angiostrongylus costaricensis TaxID=334426 RepID=A0A0R3PA49_ANGCS|nr:unnamed protein product [Angiostrongylus costaricensis]